MIREDEIVTQIDMSKSEEEIRAQEEANRQAKLRHADRREQERFNTPSMIDKMLDGIEKIKALFRKKQAQQIQNNQEKSR